MAIFLINGKGAFLIAGYNTMDPQRKASYDEKALCKAVGWLLLFLTFLMFLWPLAFHFEMPWLFWLSFILFMVVVIGFVVYANTGNHFRKINDSNDGCFVERKPVSRGKKAALAVLVIVSVQFTIGIGIMIYQGERDPVINIYESGIRIRALYGTEISFAHISEITLLDQNMRDIGIGRRTNGYDSGGHALKGHFSSPTSGSQLLFVYYSSSPTIKITQSRDVPVFISFRNSETTISTFNDLMHRFPG